MTSHVYFITDGTRYHTGDLEEILGVVITEKSQAEVQALIHHLKGNVCLPDELTRIFADAGVQWIPYDWENESNRVYVP